jgi:hypothetical protein
MEKDKIEYLDFEIDKLTRSIENVVTGDSFPTEVSILTKNDLKKIVKKYGWQFDWKREFNSNDREVYKLTITNNSAIIQGLMSFKFEETFVYMPLIESAQFKNRFNQTL